METTIVERKPTREYLGGMRVKEIINRWPLVAELFSRAEVGSMRKVVVTTHTGRCTVAPIWHDAAVRYVGVVNNGSIHTFYGGCSDNPQDVFAHSSHHADGCVPNGCALFTLDVMGQPYKPSLNVYEP